MTNEILAFWTPGPLEVIVILFVSVIGLLLVILPILYIIYSIKERRRLHNELEKLTRELHLFKEEVKENQKTAD